LTKILHLVTTALACYVTVIKCVNQNVSNLLQVCVCRFKVSNNSVRQLHPSFCTRRSELLPLMAKCTLNIFLKKMVHGPKKF